MDGAGKAESAGRPEPYAVSGGALVVRDVLLVALTVAAGVIDAVSFLGLDRVFITNMTGNLVLLGIAAGQGSTVGVGRLAVALGSFVLGALVAGRFTRGGSPSGMWPLRGRWALVAVLLLEIVFCVMWLVTGGDPESWLQLVLTAVLGVAMGAQSSAVRMLAPAGLSTTFVTGTLVDLVRLSGSSAGERARRARSLGVVAGLAGGAAAGGVLFFTARLYAPVIAPGLVAVVLAAASLQMRRARHGGTSQVGGVRG